MKKSIVILCVCVLLSFSGIIYAANVNHSPVILNEYNYKTAAETTIAIAETVPSDYSVDGDNVFRETVDNSILNENQYEKILYHSITNIEVDNSKMPHMLLNNGDMIILTQKNDSAWKLNPKDTLTMKFSLDLDTNPGSDKNGESITVGYIKNGEVIEQLTEKRKNFTYKIVADEEGSYYFFVTNMSAGSVILINGEIVNEESSAN